MIFLKKFYESVTKILLNTKVTFSFSQIRSFVKNTFSFLDQISESQLFRAVNINTDFNYFFS